MSKFITKSLKLTDLSLCHPEFSGPAKRLAQYLISSYEAGMTESRFECFETLRLPGRQNYLFVKGTSKARAWQSAHNFGLAADFVPNERRIRRGMTRDIVRGWSWDADADWTFLAEAAQRFGLTCPISWDRAHVESPKWTEWKKTIIA